MNQFPLIPPPPPLEPLLDDPFQFEEVDIDDLEESEELLPDSVEFRDLVVNEVDKNNADYHCPVCKSFLLPDECVELRCGHLFCNNCINSMNNSTVTLSTKCALCNSRSTSINYIKKSNKFAYKILCGIQIKCPNKDCNEKLLAGNLKDHLKKCEYQTTHCKYCDAKNIFRKDLKKHMVENMDVHFLKVVEELEDLKMKVNKKD